MDGLSLSKLLLRVSWVAGNRMEPYTELELFIAWQLLVRSNLYDWNCFRAMHGQCCWIRAGAQLLILTCALALRLRSGLSEPRFIRFPALTGSSRALSLLLGVTSASSNCGCQGHQLGICWTRAQIMFQDQISIAIQSVNFAESMVPSPCYKIPFGTLCMFILTSRKWFCMGVQALEYL
jgi:hypothetical protein